MMPFYGGIEASPNAAFILSLAAAAYYLFFVTREPSLQRSVLKTLAVGLLAVLSVLRDGPLLLTAALAFSALGDAVLSRSGERNFLAGLASFLVGHALYISLFASFSGAWAVPDLARVVLAIVMALGALAMMAVLWPLVSPRLRVPILVYAAAIFIMGLSALTMNSVLIVAGASLFMISDGLLASERFVISAVSPHRDGMRRAVWITYYVAQLLITLGFVLPLL
jgi:uncharacterized membrane protein YhhN